MACGPSWSWGTQWWGRRDECWKDQRRDYNDGNPTWAPEPATGDESGAIHGRASAPAASLAWALQPPQPQASAESDL